MVGRTVWGEQQADTGRAGCSLGLIACSVCCGYIHLRVCRMGTHPSGPAVVSGTDTTLKEWIQAHPEALGDAVLKRFGTDLPYLFKVLGMGSFTAQCRRLHTISRLRTLS